MRKNRGIKAIKKFSKFSKIIFLGILSLAILFVPSAAFCGVSRSDFLAALYDARGVVVSGDTVKANAAEKAEAALKLGYAGLPLTGITKVQMPPLGALNQAITRVEAVRFAVQSLALSFEAFTLGGAAVPFSDSDKLSPFERGCLTVATRMVPQIWLLRTGEGAFSPQKPLEAAEMSAIIQAVRNATNSLLLELDVSPAKGIAIKFHREGTFSGSPKWRVAIHGFRSEAEAKTGAAQLGGEYNLSPHSFNYEWSLRSELLDDWRKVEALYNFAQNFGKEVSIVPSVANTAKENQPRFWVLATVAKDGFDVGVMLPPSGVTTLAPVTAMTRNSQKPILAVNAGYFSWTGRGMGASIGTLVAGGEIVNSPYLERTTVGWAKGVPPIFAQVKWEQEVEIPFAPPAVFSTINNFNLKNNTFLVVYTPIYSRTGKRTPTPEIAATEFLLKDGVIIDKTYGGVTVREGDMILASYGVKAVLLDNLEIGTKVDIDFTLKATDGSDWSHVTEAIQAGPMIVPGMTSEGFDNNFTASRHPRTAVGVNAKGEWMFFVGDGRDGTHSIGFSLNETAGIMRAMGAVKALNLDGGGSTEFLVNGSFFNSPSEGKERPVSNAIGVFSAK